MSPDLYAVLALASRYLFSLLGVLAALFAFLWIHVNRAERRQALREVPDAGTIGELIVISGNRDLPEGQVIPVPWEGVLGSVRACDIWIPDRDVRRNHLYFSYVPGSGLRIQPLSGCEAEINSAPLNCHSNPSRNPMKHGSFLKVGSAVLRLRVFPSLEPEATFFDSASAASFTPASAAPDFIPQQMPAPAFIPQQEPSAPIFPPNPAPVVTAPLPVYLPAPEDASRVIGTAENSEPRFVETTVSPFPPAESVPENPESCADGGAVSPPRRTRRSDRWEADWSE